MTYLVHENAGVDSASVPINARKAALLVKLLAPCKFLHDKLYFYFEWGILLVSTAIVFMMEIDIQYDVITSVKK